MIAQLGLGWGLRFGGGRGGGLRWAVFGGVGEGDSAGEDAAFHAGVAGTLFDVLTETVEFVRAAPATHCVSPSIVFRGGVGWGRGR